MNHFWLVFLIDTAAVKGTIMCVWPWGALLPLDPWQCDTHLVLHTHTVLTHAVHTSRHDIPVRSASSLLVSAALGDRLLELISRLLGRHDIRHEDTRLNMCVQGKR